MLSFILNVIDVVKKMIVVSSTLIPKVRNFLRKHGRLYKEWEDPWTLNQMSQSTQEQLVRRRVLFQGNEMALSELESAWPSMREDIGGGILEELSRGNTVALGTPLPSEEENYIPRKLQHRSELRVDVFNHCSSDDYFLLSGFPQAALAHLRSSESCWEERELMEACSTEEQPKERAWERNRDKKCSDYKTKWSVWGKESSPEELTKKMRENVHWLAYEGSTIIWKHTYGDSQVLGKYIDKQNLNCQNSFICSHDDIDDFLNWNNPTILLSGDSGTGKSAFMIRMARRIKERRRAHWVIVLKINQGQMIGDLPSNIKLNDVVDLLEKSTQSKNVVESKITKHFLRDCLENSGSIAVLVDVVAEICPSHMQKVQSVLTILQESRAQYLCVAATTSSDSALKSILKCSPSVLQPFSAEDQRNYLMMVWGKDIRNNEKGELEKQVSKLVEVMSGITDYEGRNLCDVPLYTRMLAISYNGNDRKKLLRNCMADVQLKMCLLTLYRKFVQVSRKSFNPKKGYTSHQVKNRRFSSVKEVLLNLLKSYAAFLCFNDRKLLGEHYEPCKKSSTAIMNNYDTEIKELMSRRADGRPGFLHHTFREYFAALWCTEHYQSLPNLTRALYTDRFSRVRSFFDALLAEGHALHEAALSGNQETVAAALQEGHAIDSLDRGGRRALHLAASYGHRQAVALLLAAGSNPANRDAVQRWTPLLYADNALRLGAAEELLRAGSDHVEVQRICREFSSGKITYGDIVKGDMMQILQILMKPQNILCPNICSRRLPKLPSEIWEEAAVAGSVDVAEILMNSGVDMHQQTRSGMTALHVNAFCGNVEFTRLLLQHGINIDAVDISGETALHKAVRCGHSSICEELLKFDANPNFQDSLGRTPLYQSMIDNNSKCLWEMLLQHKVDIDAQTSQGTTALLVAARFENEKACRRLIDCGANVNFGDSRRVKPLHAASERGNADICQLLLQRDADVNAQDADGRSALHYAAFSSQKSARICRFLLEFGADINLRDTTGATPLLTSATLGNQWMSRTLFRYKPDINTCDERGRTVLHETVNMKSDDIRLILELGADVNSQDSEGTSGLHLAAAHANEDVCRLLIERGAHVRSYSEVYGSPLHAAAKSGHLWICRLLIEHGADVCSKMVNGKSVLHVAAKHGHDAICCLLLQQGADPNTRKVNGRTALADASKEGYETISRMLLEFGGDVHSRDSNGQTPLHVAARQGHDGICHLLLMYRANINVRDKAGRSPLQLAAANNHEAVSRLLLTQGADARLKDSEETNALIAAASSGHEDICRLLLKNGADVHAADWEGTTALHAATKCGYEEVCRLLLEHKPDIHAKDLQSRSSIDYAENKEIYKLLKRKSKNRESFISWKENNRYSSLLVKFCVWLHLSKTDSK